MSDEPIIQVDVNATVAGDYSKPAEKLIEKAFGALHWLLEPNRMRRIADAKAYEITVTAQAHADADQIAFESKAAIGERQRELISHWFGEQERTQNNRERILSKSIPLLKPNANPEKIENDWMANLFEKNKTVSDGEMQELWARLLAGEANEPGTFSKQTVNLLADLDPSDARMFSKVCDFGWFIEGYDLAWFKGSNPNPTSSTRLVPMVLKFTDSIYEKHGLNYSSLRNLESLGLIKFDDHLQFWWSRADEMQTLSYHDKNVVLEFSRKNYSLGDQKFYGFPKGNVLLTRAGYQLSTVCKTQCIPDFFEYIRERLWEKGPEDWIYVVRNASAA
jgi:Protein of unknown function (DUF2806)